MCGLQSRALAREVLGITKDVPGRKEFPRELPPHRLVRDEGEKSTGKGWGEEEVARHVHFLHNTYVAAHSHEHISSMREPPIPSHDC